MRTDDPDSAAVPALLLAPAAAGLALVLLVLALLPGAPGLPGEARVL